jgi:DNA polymerase III delta prime subunit
LASDIAVVLIGYEDQMLEMMRISNPGLQSRFRLQDAYRFEDYDDDALMRIMTKSLARQRIDSTPEARFAGIQLLGKLRNQPHFGNAREVENLISSATTRMRTRLEASEGDGEVLLPGDFDARLVEGTPRDDPLALFDDMKGAAGIKGAVRKFVASREHNVRRGRKPNPNINFLFVGSPGTGKTQAARRIGQLLYGLGILPTDGVLELAPEKMQTGFVGQAPAATREQFRRALGKVLFIDEAYKLIPSRGGQFMQEVLDTMTSILTEPEFAGKLAVVLAGYHSEIRELLEANPGLPSRFPNEILFDDLCAEDAAELLAERLADRSDRGYGYTIGDGVPEACLAGLQGIVALDGWSNGRDVESLARDIDTAIADRCFGAGDGADGWNTVTPADIVPPMDALAKRRREAAEEREQRRAMEEALASAAGSWGAPPAPVRLQAQTAPPSVPPSFKTQVDAAEPAFSPAKPATDSCEDAVAAADPSADADLVHDGELVSAEEQRRLHEEERRLIEEERRLIEEEERRIREEKERIRKEEDDMRRKKREEELARKIEELHRRQAAVVRERERRRKVKELARTKGCVNGFEWIPESGGFRCAGRGHFISNIELDRMV